jgi:hypothetical protein
MRRGIVAAGCALAALAVGPVPARAAMPYGIGPVYHDPAPQTPNDLGGNTFKFAATPEGNTPDDEPVIQQPSELCGIRGASVADANATYPFLPCPASPPNQPTTRDVHTAWELTTGRPDVAIAVLDSGIKWNDLSAMLDLRHKVRLNTGELPPPNVDGPSQDPYVNCADLHQPGSAYDLNGDGVVNVTDYACDSRVSADPPGNSGARYPSYWPDAFARDKPVLDPEDIIIAFSKPGSWSGAGRDNDHNGYVNDIAGWDFLDDDNDPYDDVQYGHGTGEARDSTAETDNAVTAHNPDSGRDERYGDQTGSCPNCMVVPLRVGDSFIADENRFAAAALYAVDNRVLVIQEALGTIDNTKFGRDAVEYAYRHGVTVIASAADEAAQHHNYPSSLPHTIVVNSVRNYDASTTAPKSYLRFNGCTNFSSKITIAIPSTSCSSNATGLAAGMAGLVYSAALNAHDANRLGRASDCAPLSATACWVTANEVRQLMASGTVGSTRQSDDVNFASGNGGPEPSCGGLTPGPPGCTNPFGPPGAAPFSGALQALVNANHPVGPLPATQGYPARKGHDQFYGWGRVNAYNAARAANAGTLPPEVEITGPEWFAQVDPGGASFDLRGQAYARGASFTCRVLVAPGSYPDDDPAPAGDFVPVASPGVCDGTTPHTGRIDGVLAHVATAQVKALFPPGASPFDGPESGPGEQNGNGRPNIDKYGFVVKVVASTAAARGEDRRNLYMHRDRSMLPGFPKALTGDGESSPLFVDLDGDNRNELVFATADGLVHAWGPDGSELPGWPVRTERLPLAANHSGARAFTSGEVPSRPGGAVLGSVAAADIDGDGVPEVVAADFEGRVHVWDASGHELWTREANVAYSGKPLSPFANVRQGQTNRTQHGFIASPVIADLDGDGRPEIVAAGMDRHVYAWHADGSPVAGFPAIVVDRSKVSSIDPTTHRVTFKSGVGADHQQGPLVDTPAIADLTGDGKAEIVVGSNEEYTEDLNVGNDELGPVFSGLSQAGVGKLGITNSRLFALKSTGDDHQAAPRADHNEDAYLDGWPFKVGQLQADLLPVVGEGITGAPVIGPRTMTCPAHEVAGPKVGVIADAGFGYVLNRDGSSCQGNDASGKANAMRSENGAGTDHPVFPAVGHPGFGDWGGGVSFLAPVAGLTRALDVAASEYQTGGQDSLAAWDPATGEFRPNNPVRMNDLQFLTGPTVADVDPSPSAPGEELLGGSAYEDLQAYTQAGQPASGFPKLTSDWMVANPLTGPFGGLDRKVVVALTRSGSVLAYSTGAAPCSPGSWPRFHHDNANSGFYDRDAAAPGKPTDLRLAAGALTFTAPGDDLMCGRAKQFQVVQSDSPITAASFGQATPLGAPQPATADAGSPQTLTVPAPTKRYLAVRAVDDQGNVGRPGVLRLRRD